MRKSQISLLLLLVVVLSALSRAQQPFVKWITDQINSRIDATFQDPQIKKEKVQQNGKGVDRQKESPSADPRSTSLVDQSSATDFVSVVANLVPVAPGLLQSASSNGSTSTSSAAGSTTATTSIYALLAALNKTSPTDPDFYAQHVFSRRFFITVGTAASKQATDNTDTPATVYGAKILLINGRELYNSQNLKRIAKVQDRVKQAAAASAKLTVQIRDLIFKALNPNDVNAQGEPNPEKVASFIKDHLTTDDAWQQTLNSIPADTMKRIQALIEDSITPFADERQTLQKEYDEISKAMQLSASYTADIRDTKGNNDHRAELIFDYGLSPRINWTVNASADYTDRKSSPNSIGGRFATSFQGDLTKTGASDVRTPMRLTFSGEGKWLTSQKPQYTFEAGLSVPLTSGVDLPIVYRYANRTAQINQKDSQARLGLSIDLSHLAQAFK